MSPPRESRDCCRKTFAWEPNAYGGHSYVARHAVDCPIRCSGCGSTVQTFDPKTAEAFLSARCISSGYRRLVL